MAEVVGGGRLHPNSWQQGEEVDVTLTHGGGGGRGQTSLKLIVAGVGANLT